MYHAVQDETRPNGVIGDLSRRTTSCEGGRAHAQIRETAAPAAGLSGTA